MKRPLRIFGFVVLLMSSSAQAHEVRHLVKSDQAFAHFIQTIRSAQKSLDVATYIFEPCHASTQVLLRELEARAKAGVQVRVLLDAISQKSKSRQPLADAFARAGIRLALYSAKVGPGINLRMHSKMLIADKVRFIAGGRNLSDSYFGLDTSYNFTDDDLFVEGERAAREASSAFEELWNAEMTQKTKGDARNAKAWSQFCEKDPARAADEVQEYFSRHSPRLLQQTAVHTCKNVSLRADLSDFAHPRYGQAFDANNGTEYMTPMRMKRKLASASVIDFLGGVKTNLEGQNWVYLPIGWLASSIDRLRAQNIPVQIMSNADIEGDMELFRNVMEAGIHWISRRDSKGSQRVMLVSSKGALTDAYALTPAKVPFFLHAKTLIRDNKDVIVGSFNLDSRSFNTNLETVVRVNDCPSLAKSVQGRVHEFRKIYQDDLKLGRVKPKPEPNFFSKMLAMMSMSLL